MEAKSKSTYLDNEEHSSDSKHDLDVMRDESDVAIAPGDIVHPVVGGKKDPPLLGPVDSRGENSNIALDVLVIQYRRPQLVGLRFS